MASNATPGPWILQGYQIWGPEDPRSKHRNRRALIGGVVDDVNDWRGAPSETREERTAFAAETTANGELMRSAPELLSSLMALLDLVEEYVAHPDDFKEVRKAVALRERLS